MSKIKFIDLRFGSYRVGLGRKLLCKHVFHTSCIESIYKPQCPLCEHPIFNKEEETLLTASEEVAIDILKNLHEHNINVKNIFTFIVKNVKKYNWLVNLMYKYCDFTELLADNLNDKILVKEIISKGKVNWFKTFYGGMTFFDLVYERTNDDEIISIVCNKLPMDNRNEDNSKTMTRPVPSMSKHRRTNSISGEIDRQIYPEQQTATIRRSLRSSTVMYPFLPTHEEQHLLEEHFDEYPSKKLYEKLYPVIPSAPPLDELI